MLSFRFSSILFALLLVPLALIIAGCSKKSDSKLPLLSTSPEVLDFGKVRPTDSPIKLTFDLCNHGGKSVAIADIISCCGCAALDIPKEPIPPNGRVAVTVSVNVWGRFGLFENDLIVKTATEYLLRVPIRGTIETDIWTDGQALRCTFDQEKQSASTVLMVYTTKYPDIVFSDTQQGNGVVLKEISRVTRNGETAIRFSVEVDIDPSSAIMRNIHIIPVDTSIAPLNVPLYCHREE
jgi:hypothetical protein